MDKTRNHKETEADKVPFTYKETLKWWNYVRWLSTISFLSVGLLQMALMGVAFPRTAFILTLTAITLLNIVYSVWLENFEEYRFYPYIHNLLDICIFSLAIYITGGIKSPLIWSYLIPILTSSITISRLAGLAACFSSIAGLFAVILLDSQELFGQTHDFFLTLKQASGLNTHNLLSYTCLFFLVYFISSFLANTLRTQNKSLTRLNVALNVKNAELVESQEKLVMMERKATIDSMARTIQHELNNPLTIISLHSEALMKTNGDSLSSRVRPIWEAVVRMRRILDKLERLYACESLDALDGVKIMDIHKTLDSQSKNQVLRAGR